MRKTVRLKPEGQLSLWPSYWEAKQIYARIPITQEMIEDSIYPYMWRFRPEALRRQADELRAMTYGEIVRSTEPVWRSNLHGTYYTTAPASITPAGQQVFELPSGSAVTFEFKIPE